MNHSVNLHRLVTISCVFLSGFFAIDFNPPLKDPLEKAPDITTKPLRPLKYTLGMYNSNG